MKYVISITKNKNGCILGCSRYNIEANNIIDAHKKATEDAKNLYGEPEGIAVVIDVKESYSNDNPSDNKEIIHG